MWWFVLHRRFFTLFHLTFQLIFVSLAMRPRKFEHKNIFKRRRIRPALRSSLHYGQCGLKILQPLRLNNRHIFRYKIFLKKAARKSDKTRRKVWFNAFPFLPLSRKVAGSRMGKGKGKLAGWAADLPSGINLIEFKNLRTGRVNYYCRQVQHKLPVKSSLVKKTNSYINLPLSTSKKVLFMTYL